MPTTTTVPTTTTTEVGLAVGEQILGTALWALVPGNSLEADRINLVFAPWGWGDFYLIPNGGERDLGRRRLLVRRGW